jgi:hypothetical protein
MKKEPEQKIHFVTRELTYRDEAVFVVKAVDRDAAEDKVRRHYEDGGDGSNRDFEQIAQNLVQEEDSLHYYESTPLDSVDASDFVCPLRQIRVENNANHALAILRQLVESHKSDPVTFRISMKLAAVAVQSFDNEMEKGRQALKNLLGESLYSEWSTTGVVPAEHATEKPRG